MSTLYKTATDVKTLEVEDSSDGRFRLVITLQKLGVVSKLDYFISRDEASSIASILHNELAKNA